MADRALCENEAAAVAVFTASCPGIFSLANRALRRGDAAAAAPFLPFLAWLSQAVARLPPVSGVVYRAWNDKNITTDFTVGTVVTWHQFSSTAAQLSVDQLQSFGSNADSGEAGVLLALRVANGRLLGPLSFFPAEDEVILPPVWRGAVMGSVRQLGHLSTFFAVDLTAHTVLELVELAPGDSEPPPPPADGHGLGLVAEEVRARLEASVTDDPTDITAQVNLGVVLADHFADAAGALRAFDAALQRRPRHAVALSNRVALLDAARIRGDRDALAAADVAAQFETAVQCADAPSAAGNNFGVHLATTGDFAGARQQFEATLRVDPHCAPAANNLGVLLAHSEENDAASAQFRAAVAADRFYLPAYANHALLSMRSRDFSGAAEHWEGILRLDPNHVPTRFNLATMWRGLGDADKAAAQYQALLGIDPRNARAAANLALVLQDQRSYDAAEAQFRVALAIEPQDVETRLKLANALRAAAAAAAAGGANGDGVSATPSDSESVAHARLQRAKVELLRVVDDAPTHLAALNTLGLLCVELQADGDARWWLGRACEVAPRDVDTLRNYGSFLFRQAHDARAAIDVFRRVLDVDPANASAMRLAGEILLGPLKAELDPTGVEALALLRRATSILPTHVRSRLGLALALRNVGDVAGAREQVDAAYALDASDPEVLRAVRDAGGTPPAPRK